MKSKTTGTKTAKSAKPAKAAKRASSGAQGAGLCIATVARSKAEGVWVNLPHDDRGPVKARVMVPPGGAAGEVRVAEGTSVVVMLVPSGAPVIMGELRALGDAAKAEARVEGRRVEVVAEDEIALTCGEASLVLRRNGRVVLRGVQVETRAKGLNRIKGGTVAIN
ncbi:MAG: hypothetical protein U0326_19400 [Polyangiales bacterium]